MEMIWFELLEDWLHSGGWEPFWPGRHGRRLRGTSRIDENLGGGSFTGSADAGWWMKDGELVVTVGAFGHQSRRPSPYRPPRGGRISRAPTWAEVQSAFDDMLEKLTNTLERMARAMGANHTRVVFESGGRLVLPQWFIKRMEELGVEIVVLDHEREISEQLHKFGELIPLEDDVEVRYQAR